MNRPLPTVIVGFGKIAAGYAEDPVTRKVIRYATHAQVLADHPAFEWNAVVDPSDDALRLARERWGIAHAVRYVDDLPESVRPEIAVIATPPGPRTAIVKQLPGLRAVMVEKPLGGTIAEAGEFLHECGRRGILVQVNLWRRGDQLFQELAAGRLAELIGPTQLVFGVYGNGLLNNGTHLIDFIRMLIGEVSHVQATGAPRPASGSSVAGDSDIPFVLGLRNGVTAAVQPLRFEHYREVSLDIWGEHGRLAVMNEGLNIQLYKRGKNRAVQGELEIASDDPRSLAPTVSQALYRMYDNLADAVNKGVPLWSPGASSLVTSNVIDALFRSVDQGRTVVEV